MARIQPHIRAGSLGAEYALLPGDPQRVEKVKKWLEEPQEIAFNREYKTITGYYKGVKVAVTSTGIGSPSLAIAIEELKNIGVHTMIRIGSCGAVQDHIKLGDLIIPAGAVRDEGTSSAYVEPTYPAIPHPELLFSLIQATKAADISYHCGTIRSHDSFYTDSEEEKEEYWRRKGILGSDMETSALFVIGRLNRLNVASVLNVVVEAKGDTKDGINQFVDGSEMSQKSEQLEIMTALEAIIDFNKKLKKETVK